MCGACRAMHADLFLMFLQPALKYSWNMMMASSFGDMRLNIACAKTASYFTTHDNTLNLHVVARQPHLDPSFRKATIEGPMAPQTDMLTMGVKIVFPGTYRLVE